MAKVCIIGKEEVKKGKYYPVNDDLFLSTIRGIKEFFKISTGNKLVVCEQHLEEAYEKRKEFESSVIKMVAIVAVFAVLVVILAILNGNLNLILSTLLLILLLFVLLAFISLFRYFPNVELSEKEKSYLSARLEQKKKEKGKEKKESKEKKK